MRVVLFYHSLVSDWNHGHAHFLRGVATELLARGHDVHVYERRDAWSVRNLVAQYGRAAADAYRLAYPMLRSHRYDLTTLDIAEALDDADLVLVHEWNDPALVRRIGEQRAAGGAFRLFFHDTHHRSVTDPTAMEAYDLRHFDGVLAFGEVIRHLYLEHGWAAHAWTWHEAADTRVFRPVSPAGRQREGDLVWIGNWGDGERAHELRQFLVDPARELGLRATAFGVRFPPAALAEVAAAGISYGGWLPNFRVPETLARFAATIHVPRRPYATALPGIPTIRVFEALACGTPLVSAPWEDSEGLFSPGRDFVIAQDTGAVRRALHDVLHDRDYACALAEHGRRTILARHTCAHRVDELLAIARACGWRGDAHEESKPAA